MAGNRGGRRPGAGRPRGAGDTVKRYTRADHIRDQVVEFLKTNEVAIFDGDSLDLAISVYKNENLPLGLRLHAVALALPFERPRLVATANVTKHIDGEDRNFARLFQQIEARLALMPPEARVDVIEMLRSTDDDAEEIN